jgi:hypothetical protein
MDFSGAQSRVRAMRGFAIALLPVVLAVLLASCGGRASSQPLLGGDGIGSVRFGESPAAVAARLGHLYGSPVGAKQFPHGYMRDVCGFYSESWNGVGAASHGRQFAANLAAWFRDSRFVGYTYSDDFRATVWDQYASHPMGLATSRGLKVGDPVGRGRGLYGRRFVLTTEAQGTPPDRRLVRVPVWEVSSSSGRIWGGVGRTALAGDAFGKHRVGIHSIVAGATPNTLLAGRQEDWAVRGLLLADLRGRQLAATREPRRRERPDRRTRRMRGRSSSGQLHPD